MRQATALTLGITAALATSACGPDNEEYIQALRDALAKSEVSLIEVVQIAEAEQAQGDAIRAALLVDQDPVFSVRASAGEDTIRYRIDLGGSIVNQDHMAYLDGPCAGSITLVQALQIAEAEASGQAVVVVPDDDVACAFEIQVLQPDNLWEVKVSQTGQVLESEESDENGTED